MTAVTSRQTTVVPAESPDGQVDFDLHGVVGIRVLQASARDVAVVERALGPLQRPLDRVPDITVRFVDDLGVRSPLTFVGWPESGYDDDAFYLLRGQPEATARAVLPFADVGKRCDIVLERAVGAVPHLVAVVNFTALAKGVLPLHASAFLYRDVGVLATGWAKGGKTESLLAFTQQGAHYVGDEWVYLTADGSMFGLPEPIRLWEWQLRQRPELWGGLSPVTRARLTGLAGAARGARALGRRLPAASSAVSVLRRAEPVVRRQAYLQVSPLELFGAEHLESAAPLDVLLLLTSHDHPTVTVEPVPGELVARRMAASLAEERAPFMAHYRQFRFARPGLSSDVVEHASELEARLLERLLAGRPAHHVRHPYPLDLRSLVEPIESVLDLHRAGDGSAALPHQLGGTS